MKSTALFLIISSEAPIKLSGTTGFSCIPKVVTFFWAITAKLERQNKRNAMRLFIKTNLRYLTPKMAFYFTEVSAPKMAKKTAVSVTISNKYLKNGSVINGFLK